jgi:hypothetical protein
VWRPGWRIGHCIDLRRTFRSGLSVLGIDYAVRELMLNHLVGGDLDQRYDRHPRWSCRIEAAGRRAQHVVGIVASERATKAVQLRTA